jgi:Cu2+-containing amine oxidase
MAVDGVANRVVEVDSQPSAPGPDNPHGNAWETVHTVLGSEAAARRDTDPLRALWKVESTARACRPTGRATVRWTARTSSSGTRSASTTSSGRRTGRWCRWGRSGSCSGRSGFFDGNPALDTPPTAADGGSCHTG